MSFFDTSVRRESACPVHFVWDGNGYGRPVVRVGFMMLLVGALLTTAGFFVGGVVIGKPLVLVAAIVWLLGQVLTKLSRP